MHGIGSVNDVSKELVSGQNGNVHIEEKLDGQ